MINIMKNLLGRFSSETPQINYGLVLGKYLVSLCRSNRICRCYRNAFADRGGNMSVTDTNNPNSPILVTITLLGEKCNSFLPIKQELPTSLFISVWFLQGCTGTACWIEMSLGQGAVLSWAHSVMVLPFTNSPHEREPLEDPSWGSRSTITPGLELSYSSNSTSPLTVLPWPKLTEGKVRTSPNPTAFESCPRNRMPQDKHLRCSSHTATAVS